MASEACALALERAKELQTNLSSEHPSFIKQMHQSSVNGKGLLDVPMEFCRLHLPNHDAEVTLEEFCRLHLPNHDAEVTLEDGNGESYIVKFVPTYIIHLAKFIAGWKRFSNAHKLLASDTLVFQLLRPCYFKKYQSLGAQAMSTTQGNVVSPRGLTDGNDEPDHLLVLVHGILASPSDWIYVEAELKRRLGRNFLIYASSCNTYIKTFGGIDGAGKRLADKVTEVVKKKESLKRISFLAHSLGGLFARYAITVLHSPDDVCSDQSSDSLPSNGLDSNAAISSRRGRIAGLEPVNFVTLATPHLGVRGRKQLPFLFGVPILEKLAPSVASTFVGRTGSQLFLTDGKPNRPPLLLRMASDCEDGKFISALGAFRSRILYANVSYDHMVGWRTSSIRRETELCKPPRRSLDGYKHVVDVEYCPPVSSDGPNFPPEAAKAKEAAQKAPNTENTKEYHEIMEEEMIRSLQQLGWKKVDVSFHSALWPFFAHNNIHVKNEWFHNAGAGVVAHVADSLKQQEKQQDSAPFISASL